MVQSHRRRAMAGRDPHEPHRTATPLELLYDLIFVVAIGSTSSHLASALSAGQWWTGLVGFAFCMVAILLAWTGFAWFASAYDTDDWLYRLLAMVQMLGVTILALGVPDIFASLGPGQELRLGAVVVGFVVMRLALLAQHVRAWRRDRARRGTLAVFVVGWAVAQLGWVTLLVLDVPVPWVFLAMLPLYALEIGVPWLAERKGQLPWHANHIAERYSLLVIITLGEVVVGTVGAVSVLLADRGWTVGDVVLMVAGVATAMGLWWVYFVVPAGPALAVRRSASVGFNWVHFALYMTIAGVGAGLRVVADVAAPEHAASQVRIGPAAAVLTVVVPIAVFVVLVNVVLYRVLLPTTPDHDRLHGLMTSATLLVLGASVGAVALGAPVMAGLAAACLAPIVTIAAYETRAHLLMTHDLERAEARAGHDQTDAS